jgi:hypothetical protein
MLIKFNFIKFKFIEPDVISEEEFEQLKFIILNNRKVKLYPSLKYCFIEIKSKLISILIFCFIFYSLIVINDFFKIETNNNWFTFVYFIFLVVPSFSFIIGDIFTILYFFDFVSDRKKYFKKLKKIIINSSTYYDFMNNFKK